MKKFVSVIMVIAALFCCMAAGSGVMAESASGSTGITTTFKVETSHENAYIVLSSATGLANVAQHDWKGRYVGNGDEKTHGFYWVVTLCNGKQNGFVWAPSATTNTSGISTCDELRINFPKGNATYWVHIVPLTPIQAERYWRVDNIDHWVYPASWRTTITSGCAITEVH